MTTLRFIKFCPAEYLADTTHLKAIEHGAYMLLLMHYWVRGSLPDDEAVLARIARMNGRQWAAARPVLATLFEPSWKHKRVEQDLAELARAGVINAENGRAGGMAKAAKAAASNDHQGIPNGQMVDSSINANPLNPLDHDVAKATISPSHLRSKNLESKVETSTQVETQQDRQEHEKRARAQERACPVFPAHAFATFWTLYPHKVGKGKAMARFALIAKKGQVSFDDLMAGLRRYVGKRDDRPWCNPDTWLNQGRWDDEPAAGNDGSRGRAGRLTAAFDALDERIARSVRPDPVERSQPELRFAEPGGLPDPDDRYH